MASTDPLQETGRLPTKEMDMPTTDTDGALLAAWLTRRDEAAWGQLVGRHGAMVVGVARTQGLGRHDADDVAQAAFVLLVRHAARLAHRSEIGSWLHLTAVNLARNARRARQARLRHEQPVTLPEVAVTPSNDDDLPRILHQALACLPEGQRAALLLVHAEGLSQDEAAGRLGVPIGTVGSWLTRGARRLRERLQRQGVSGPVAAGALALLVQPGQAADLAPLISVPSASPTPGASDLVHATIKEALMTRIALAAGCALAVGGGGILALHLTAAEPAPPPSTYPTATIELLSVTGPAMALRSLQLPVSGGPVVQADDPEAFRARIAADRRLEILSHPTFLVPMRQTAGSTSSLREPAVTVDWDLSTATPAAITGICQSGSLIWVRCTPSDQGGFQVEMSASMTRKRRAYTVTATVPGQESLSWQEHVADVSRLVIDDPIPVDGRWLAVPMLSHRERTLAGVRALADRINEPEAEQGPPPQPVVLLVRALPGPTSTSPPVNVKDQVPAVPALWWIQMIPPRPTPPQQGAF